MLIAPLLSRDADADGAWSAIRKAFARSHGEQAALAVARGTRTVAAPALGGALVFALPGTTVRARIGGGGAAAAEATLTEADVAVLRPGQALELEAPCDLLVLTATAPLPAAVPSFLRPDADPAFADQPGGCATDGDAYRRILLTWSDARGPHTWTGANVHRVRMRDSFSHYHPVDGGFDELYLVHDAPPGARVLHSDRVGDIVGEVVTDTDGLVASTPVARGDLVYIPRGEMHRAVGGVLAHVITVPGFVPGAEIGVDHHLHRINQRLGLHGARALPVHADARHAPVIR